MGRKASPVQTVAGPGAVGVDVIAADDDDDEGGVRWEFRGGDVDGGEV